jgi:hypothetical protein
MADQEYEPIKIVTKIADPPTLTDEEIAQINEEGRRLSMAFRERTRHMEILTADDLRTLIR